MEIPSVGERERRRWAAKWQSASGSHRKREREREPTTDMHSFTSPETITAGTAADGHGPICSGRKGEGSLLRSDSRCRPSDLASTFVREHKHS